MKRYWLLALALLTAAVTAYGAPWYEPPGGSANDIRDTDRVLIEQSGISRTATRGQLIKGTAWTYGAVDLARGQNVGGFKNFTSGIAAKDAVLKGGPWVDVRAFGAVGNGTGNQQPAIQAAVDFVYANGGGTVFLPAGTYRTLSPVAVKSNVQLVGAGYASRIDNVAVSGFAKCAVVTGNVGDVPGGTGMYAETRYSLEAVAAGSSSVTFASAGDATTFQVGDVVAIMSYEKHPSDTRYPVYNDLNVVAAKSGGTLTLKYAVADTYSTASGAPQIARITGGVSGYDGSPLWVAQNCAVRNLRLTNATGLGSGWYALFAAGVGNTYENLWADNCSGVLGSNSLARSVIRNVKGSFDLRGVDMGDLQVSNVMEDIKISRFGVNQIIPGSVLGVGVYSGADVVVNRLEADLGGYGQVSMLYVNRGKYQNFKVTNTGSGVNVGVLSGYGYDMQILNGTVNGTDRLGIYVVGERAKVQGNTVLNAGRTGAFNAISIKSTVAEYIVTGNVCGAAGARTTNDRIVQDVATSAAAVIKDNITYDTVGGIPAVLVDSTYVDSAGGVGPLTFKTYSITGGSTRPAAAYRIFANGLRNGTAGTKQIKLVLGANDIAVVNYGASDTAEWSIEAVISNDKNSTRARVMGKGYLGAALQYSNRQDLTGAFDSDTTLTLQGSLGSASDTLTVYQFIVQPIY